MNKKALILSLIPIFVVVPLLLSFFVSHDSNWDNSYNYKMLRPQPPQMPQQPAQSNPINPINPEPGRPGFVPGNGEIIDPDLIDPAPTLQFYSDTTHTNTTAVLTAIATDYLDNAGIRWIKIYEDGQEWGYKDCQGHPTCTYVKVKTETQNTTHTYYATTMDLGNHLVQSQSITIWFEGLNQPPIIDNYLPQDLTPEVNENETLHFEVWAHDPNNDPLTYIWKLDGQQVSSTTVFDYHPDFNASGLHDVYVIVSDGKGGTAVKAWNVTVINVLLNSSCFLNFNPQSPITYGTLLNASCYCTNPEAQARLWRDGLNIDNENGQFVLLGAGTYNYTCNVTQTQNYNSASNSSLYTINRANHTIHLALNGQENDLSVRVGTLTNATGWLEVMQGATGAILYRNGQQVAEGSPATEIATLPVGLYNYTYYYPESQNYTAESITRWLNVTSKINSSCSLSFVPPSPITYDMQPFIALCSCTNPEAPAQMWRNGLNVTNEIGLPVTLAANPSGYNYVCNVSETQNYNGATNTSVYIINKANITSYLHLALNGSESNLTVTYPSTTNATGWSDLNLPDITYNLYRNDVLIASGNPASDIRTLGAGVYNYVYNTTGNQNYSAGSTPVIVLTVNQGTTILNLTAIPSWNVTYPTQTNVSCSANNNQIVLTLTRNGQLVNNPDIQTLGAGLYYYNCSTPGNENWSAASVANTLNVSKAASLVNLILNGIDGNITVNVGESVNATGWLIIPSLPWHPPVNESIVDSMGSNEPGNEPGIDSIPQPQLYEIWLYKDGGMVGAGNHTVTYITSFPEPGLHNFTVRYPGTQNYSESSETHWVNVIGDSEAPIVNLIFPPDGSTTGENVTVIYNVTDNMDLILDCDIYSNTSGTWQIDGSRQTYNATNGNWSYSNLVNGIYIWNVECRDDSNNSAFAPDNWTFTVNVTGPDLIPPDVWNVSANPQVINQSDSTMLEAYAHDNVAVDSVLAQVTYPDLTQANYTMVPGMIVHQYLYNFTNTAQIGNYSVRIFANDTSNNWNTTETTWFVVQTIPGAGNTTTIITQPANNSIFNLSQIFVASANVTAVGGDVIGCNATITFSNNTVLNTSQPVNVLGNILNGTTVVTQWNVTAAAVGVSNITVTTTCEQGGSSFDTVYNITVINETGDIEPPVIIFVPPTPANGSVVNVNYVYVNTSITDNVAVDTAILDWNNTNFTMAGAEPNYYLNVTGLANGLYIYRVYANDTSNNWNVSETRYVTVNTTMPNLPPVVNLTSPLNNTVFHNQQDINFSYIATDDNDLSFLCTIFLDNIANQSQITQNNTITNFTINGIAKGIHSWRVECIDSGGLTGVSETWLFTIALHDVEIVANYTNSINGIRITMTNGTDIMDDPANLSQNETYFIRYRINNKGYPEINPEQVNVSVWLINATGRYLVSSYLQSISQYHLGNVTFNPSAFAPGQYNITVNATIIGFTDINPADNERNRTVNIVQVGDFVPPWWLNETVTPPSPAVYGSGPYTFRIEWYDNVNVAQVWFEFDGTNYTPTCVPPLPTAATNCSYIFTDLAAATHSYRWHARDTSNNYNATSLLTYIVTQAPITGLLHLALNGSESNLTVTYPSTTNATGWSDLNLPDITYNLYRNDVLIASGNPASDIRTLGAGVYNYVYNTTGNQNYSAGSTPVRTLIVNQGTTVLNLTAQPGWNVTVGTQTNVSCAANNNEVLINLYRNNSLVASGYNLVSNVATLPVGNYNYTCNTTGSQNWSAASTSNVLVVSPLLPGEVHLWLNGTEGNLAVTYANEMLKFNASTPYGNVSIYRNGSLIAGPNASYTEVFENLAAGYYNITAYSTGDANHSAASVTYFLTINKANSSLTLLLNGNNTDITIIEGESVNHTAILNVPSTGNLTLIVNTTPIINVTGASPFTYIYQYNVPNYYNATAYYAGNENYSSSSATHFINVIEAIHDISVDNIWQVKFNGKDNRTVYLNDLLNVSARISNLGNANESNVIINFTDTYLVGSNPVTNVIETRNISLNTGDSQVVSFNYTALPKGTHTLRIKATVAGDINPANDFKTLDLVVWSVNDIVSNDTREIFINNMNPPLNTIFTVYLPIQNNFASQGFYDFPALLTIQPNDLMPLDPVQNYSYLAPGGFIVLQWRVNATTSGLHNIGAIEGVNELIIPSKQINVG